MRVTHLRRIGALAAVSAVGIGAVTSVGASAAGKQTDEPTAATITMVSNGKNLEFQGPRTVSAGAKLQIVNATDPSKVGPHTFTLVDKDLVPKSKQDIKDCFKLKLEVCTDVLNAHKVNIKTEKIGKPVVDVGAKGWDTSFGKKGDTWFSLEEGETHDRQVTAKPGDTLYYFCAIHPFMQGKIKVVK